MIVGLSYGGCGEQMILNDRDRLIVWTVARLRLSLGRHIRALCGFTGERACDRRLRLLLNEGYLKRERMIYGVAGIYTVTAKGKREFDLSLSIGTPKLDQIKHDIAVADTVIYLVHSLNINLSDIQTEKELRHEQGFSNCRGHMPDLVYVNDSQTVCIEVELSLKTKDRLLKNIKSNYLAYDIQMWVVPKDKSKIRDILKEAYNQYPNIEVIDLEGII